MLNKYKKSSLLVIFICSLLFIIPFFWLKLGEMDLGGDSNRLYFYDPLANLESFAIYAASPYGVSKVLYNQYFIPFLLFLAFLKTIFISPTILIAILNGFKLSGAFLFTYLIIKELLSKEEREEMTLGKSSAAIVAALFYAFSPSMIDNMKYALVTHSQIFLNPMMFYFLLRYLITSSYKYLWIAILVTIIFSSNFSFLGPTVFTFYPLAITFLLLYNLYVLKKPFPWKGLTIGGFFFLGLHAFHQIPLLSSVFDKGSELNTRAFESSSSVNVGLEYFNGILSGGKVSNHILLPLENQHVQWSLLIIPLLTILGFLSPHRKGKTFFLITIFFLITLFLVSANITHIGVEFYRALFFIPGFGMFRNFFGQWQWVYTFFYTLLVGFSLFYLWSKLKRKYVYMTAIFAISIILMQGWSVFTGDIVNVFHRVSKNVSVVVRMDPHYEKMLEYIKKLPNDGKIIHMPFTDYGYNIVGGANKGVYIGQSMVSLLAGKNDFSGYQNIDPFSEVFVQLVKEKNYSLIKRMMSLLQIRYILYNSDELVSNKFFPDFPYGHAGVPTSQPELKKFVESISNKKIFESGNHTLYEVNKNDYLPHFYIPSHIYLYDNLPKYNQDYSHALSFFPVSGEINNKDPRIAFLNRSDCQKILSKEICNKNELNIDIKKLQIKFVRINPTKYKVEIAGTSKQFILVFQNSYNFGWKIYHANTLIKQKEISDSYFNNGIVELIPVNSLIDTNLFETNGLTSISTSSHIKINGYANAWYIDPAKMSKKNLNFIVELEGQKLFYYSALITIGTLILFIIWGIKIFFKSR